MSEGQGQEPSYRAFISYSHSDDAMARTLHRQLETYRLPKHLIGIETPRGIVPPRLTPIFRDLDELSAADDLSAEIKAALARSDVLVILASPAAKASKWVNLEIETFRALHGNARPVLVALLEGEPADAFPPGLTASGSEPVAADFRREAGGGKRLALLKLVAGISGAPLDSLVQRDAQRQLRRVTAITGGALAAALIMALLLFVALRAQADAERQRQEAEGLVEYMLTDLRDKLKGDIGRLSVMTAVNERAMKYYGGQEDLKGLSAESLRRRARILHAMGEDDQKQEKLNLALSKFLEAHRTTNALLSIDPDDINSKYDHSQSEFWLGRILEKLGKYQKALNAYSNYRELSKQLLSRDPNNVDYIKEVGWAESAIGSIALNKLSNPAQALPHFEQYFMIFVQLQKKQPDDYSTLDDLANSLAWLSDCYFAMMRFEDAKSKRLEEIKTYEKMYFLNKSNVDLQASLLISYRSLAKISEKTNKIDDQGKYSLNSVTIGRQLVKLDPDNSVWRGQAARAEAERARYLKNIGNLNEARIAASRAIGYAFVNNIQRISKSDFDNITNALNYNDID